jgi:putative SOS response-associated peptidase YedK
MCNLYTPPTPPLFSKLFGVELYELAWGSYVAPLKPGPYLKPAGSPEVGQWGMIAPGSKSRVPTGQTNNARRETLASRRTYADAWLGGRRCLIPAASFIEPYYPGHDPKAKSISWQFARADGEPWALAGIWSEWTDPATGEVVPSYSMITQNCDGHPLLSLMHKPELDKATGVHLTNQDKRAVVPLERTRWDEWLHGSVEQAESLIQLPELGMFSHGAADPAKNIPLPGIARQTQISEPPSGLFYTKRLYAFTVLYDVYILGSKGEDPLPAMLAKPTQGQLIIRKRYPARSDTALNALLMDPAKPGADPLMEMHYIRLVGMTDASMVIEGTVGHSFGKSQKSKVEFFKQRWLCKAPGAKVTVDVAALRSSKGKLAQAIAADPFHPIWDDLPDQTAYGPLDPSIW